MPGKRRFLIVALLLIAGGVTVFFGDIDEDKVDFSSVMEIWGDVLRDVDQFGLQFTRVSVGKEMRIGKELSQHVFAWGSKDEQWETYVSKVGQSLLPHIRRKGIKYKFQVINSPHINAFAMPGGYIFITTGMLNFLQSEAELAAILGHEIAHVDLRHCIERFQYQLALKRVGLSGVGLMIDIARNLVTVGYHKYQEVDADTMGVRLSINAGYAPHAAISVFNRLIAHYGLKESSKAKTPVGEVVVAVGEAIGSYIHSHPVTTDRVRQLKTVIKRNRRRLIAQTFYIGTTNYAKKIPKEKQAFPEETIGLVEIEQQLREKHEHIESTPVREKPTRPSRSRHEKEKTADKKDENKPWPIRQELIFLKHAQNALSRADLEAAYRLIEDGLVSEYEEVRVKFRQFLKENSELYKGARRSFSVVLLRQSSYTYGKEEAKALERQRLYIYATIASAEDYSKARQNFLKVFGGVFYD